MENLNARIYAPWSNLNHPLSNTATLRGLGTPLVPMHVIVEQESESLAIYQDISQAIPMASGLMLIDMSSGRTTLQSIKLAHRCFYLSAEDKARIFHALVNHVLDFLEIYKKNLDSSNANSNMEDLSVVIPECLCDWNKYTHECASVTSATLLDCNVVKFAADQTQDKGSLVVFKIGE